jgi:NAD(P)-dependent dehydrogenase (short-subunit alcohol dehydrogenase family)
MRVVNSLFDLSNKVALVTGGSRGIGAMIAEGYVSSGVRTYITSRKVEACEETSRRLSKIGECVAMPADLSTSDGIASLVRELTSRERQLDILVHNAGAVWGEAIDDFPESAWDKVMDINVKAPFFLTQALLPMLQAAASTQDPARIIFIGSIDGLNVNRLPTFSYGPSKAAVHHLARTLAAHLADRQITVNAVAPGLFPSKMTAATIATMGEEIRRNTPLKRHGEPKDMAGIAIYLASPAASFVTGVIIPVDGGLTGARPTL